VVFVVDASHSQGPAGIAAQLEVIAPYLLQVPDAQVEVVVYRRFAERLFGRFVTATDFAAALHAVPAERLAPGNGSNLELGAALAAQVLEGSASPSRVVLFTDEELREGFTNEAALEALKRAPKDTVVHVVSRSGFSDGELSERRNDEDPLSPIAKASGGVFFELSGHPVDLLQGTRTMTPLVRPTRIDALEIDSALLTIDHPSEFVEGATLRATAIDAEPPREIKVRGLIWGRPFERVVTADATLTRALPALAIGLGDIESQLSDDEVRVAAQAAGAVSRVTSLLAARESAGASTIGRTLTLGVGQSMWGCGCGGSFGTTSSCGGFFRGGPQPDYDEALRGLLGAGLTGCGAGGGHLHLEATGDEIVDVELTGLSPTVATCVTELVWGARLTSIFAHHRSYELDLQRVVTAH
jgi:hypothetical protein